MAVRSDVLARGTFAVPAGGPVNLFVVPAGEVWIVRSVIVSNTTGATVTPHFRYRVGGAGSGTVVGYFSIATLSTFISEEWRVVDQGDALAIRAAAAMNLDVWASGAKLVL